LQKETKILSSRQIGSGGVMIWTGIGYHGRTDIKFIGGKINSKMYLQLISEQIERHATRISGEKFTFQQDNTAVHSAKVVKSYFKANNIPLLEWPARSPDINVIENLWKDLARAAKGRQFNNMKELKQCILLEWGKINKKRMKKLYESLPKRMISIIQKSEGSIY
jgi:transposase